MIHTVPRVAALERSGGCCEAMVLVKSMIWGRCGKVPVEVHHALTRARGGALLDQIGESYHLICLCHEHHRAADGEEAYEGDLLIDGYAISERGRVVYYGTDPYLKEKYRAK